jgi:hypothetical protein
MDYQQEYERLKTEHEQLLTVLRTSVREYERMAARYRAEGDNARAAQCEAMVSQAAQYEARAEGCASVLRNMGLEVE